MYLRWRDQRSRASLGPLTKSTATGLAIAAIALAAPATAAAQATLTVDSLAPCYREQSTVHLVGGGFTQNGQVVFTRDGTPIGDPIVATAAGELFPQLILPGLVSGQKRLTYVATDQTDPALTAQLSLLVTATDVGLRPEGGAPTACSRSTRAGSSAAARSTRTWSAPGAAGGRATCASAGSGAAASRSRRASGCSPRAPRPGKYRVQFDTFRRFESKRTVETEFIVTVFRTVGHRRGDGGSARPADLERERAAACAAAHRQLDVVDRAVAAPLHAEPPPLRSR